MAKKKSSVQHRQVGTNAQAVRIEVVRTMGVVGIGSRYHDARLDQFAQGAALKELILSTWTVDGIKRGRGITIFGSSDVAGDLHMMMARSLHLAGARVLVVGLQELSRLLQTDESDIDEVGALFVRRFEDAGNCSLRSYEVGLVEEYLDKMIGDNRSLFPWMAGTPDKKWWSKYIRNKIKKHNGKLFEVGT